MRIRQEGGLNLYFGKAVIQPVIGAVRRTLTK